MRRRVALLVLGVGALLLTPGASGVPNIPGDPTPPLITPVITGTLGDAGWYRSNVTLNWTVVDPESIILSTTGCDARTLTADTPGTQIICSAATDGGETTVSKTIKLDKTAPAASATPSRPADANGWYNHELTVGFAGNDATSGLASCSAAQAYGGPDTTGTSVSGTCRDRAGNTAPAALPFKYDETAPQARPVARAPDANGWYNHAVTVSFQGADGTSGVASCTQVTYGGPDNPSVALSGTCVDRAGNQSPSSGFTLKYDGTAPQATATPSRAADVNGWHNHSVTVSFAGSDATSGLASCDPPKTYAGPDAVNASVTGSCSDRAGNVARRSFGLKYDGTLPHVNNAVAVRGADRGGWYNRPVAFVVQGADATSGIDSCPALTYSGPDSAAASVSAACFDRAGNAGTKTFPLKYDDTGPDVTARAGRDPDAGGWYSHPVTVSFTGSDSASGLDSCTGPERYEGPDSRLAVVSGICLDRAGNVGLASLQVHYDATAPEVTGATPKRPPDANGWYNHPLVVGFEGSDATSGLEACTQATYAGPDSVGVSVSGSCRDRAGNGSRDASFTLKYDATAPTLNEVRAKAGNRTAGLSWVTSPDTVVVEVLRAGATVYRGSDRAFTDTRLKNGVRYRYTVTGYDEAHNAAAKAVTVRPTAPLIAPAAGAAVKAPVRLAWAAVEQATYYNVQVWRQGKILSAWPKRPSMEVRRSWTYGGRRYRLAPGRYRWFVWPGYGPPASKKYGRLLGSSSFVVKAPRR